MFASPMSFGKLPYWPDMLLRRHILPAAKRLGILKRIGGLEVLPERQDHRNKCKFKLPFDLAVGFLCKFSSERCCMVMTFWTDFRQLRHCAGMTRLQKAC